MARHNPKPKIDRDALHRLWWGRRERGNAIELSAVAFAEEAHFSHHTISRIIREMCEDGRLKKVGKTRYLIRDPNQGVDPNETPVKLTPRSTAGVQWE